VNLWWNLVFFCYAIRSGNFGRKTEGIEKKTACAGRFHSLSDKLELDDESLDPLKPDTDGDVLGDASEIGIGTDPSNPDSDDDLLSDYIEVTLGLDPLNPDSDNGRIDDGVEVMLHQTDPLDADDDNMTLIKMV